MPGISGDKRVQDDLERSLNKEINRYANAGTVSLKRAVSHFNHLTEARRTQFLQKDDYGFFQLLVDSKETDAINDILSNASPSEQEKMDAIILDTIKRELEVAIYRGDVTSIHYYMNAYPTEEAQAIIQDVIAADNCACFRAAYEDQHMRATEYLLEHDLSRDIIQDSLDFGMPNTEVKEKPTAKSTKSCFSSIKHSFEQLVGCKQSSKVHPTDIEKNLDANSTDSETNSDDSANHGPNQL